MALSPSSNAGWTRLFWAILLPLLSLHLLCIAWVRTIRNWQNLPLTIFLTLLAVYLPLAVFHFTHIEHFRSIMNVGETTHVMESLDQMELYVFRDTENSDSLGVYTVPFRSLKAGQAIKHHDWSFSLIPDNVIPHASVGGPQSRMLDSNHQALRGIAAENGLSRDIGIRLYHTQKRSSAGRGLKLSVLQSNPSAEETYLLYAAFPGEVSQEISRSLPIQTLERPQSDFSLALLPRRNYPGFSWKVERGRTSQWLVILNAQGSKEHRRLPFSLHTHAKYKGYTFRPSPPLESASDPNLLVISITTAPFQYSMRILECLLVLSLLGFLLIRLHRIISETSGSKEGNP